MARNVEDLVAAQAQFSEIAIDLGQDTANGNSGRLGEIVMVEKKKFTKGRGN